MSRPVEITQPADSVICDEARQAAVVFNVHNLHDTEIQVAARIQADPPVDADWFDFGGPAEWRLAGKATEQISVQLQVPDSVEPGTYTFKLTVYLPETSGEDFTIGEPVSFEVKAKPPEEPEPPRRWWIVAAAIAGLLLVTGLAWYLLKPELVDLPDVEKVSFRVAYQRLTAAGLELGQVDSVISRELAQETVVRQKPHPKESPQVKKGSKVDLTVAQHLQIAPADLRKILSKHLNVGPIGINNPKFMIPREAGEKSP